ncbi:MAG: SPOR domain-containing protein [Bacteroidota bacterium]
MLAFREEAIGYGVQVGAYFNFYKLLDGLDRLSAKGFQNTVVQNGMKNNEPVFRIIVGPFATKPEADSMRRKLANSKMKGITVDLANLR